MKATQAEIITGIAAGNNPLPFDALDLICMVGAAAVAPYAPIAIAFAAGQYFARRSANVVSALLRAMDVPEDFASHPYTVALLPGAAKLLSASMGEEELHPHATRHAMSVDAGHDMFDAPTFPTVTQDSLRTALRRLPLRPTFDSLKPRPTSSYAVPVGIDAEGVRIWCDMATDLLHAGIYGQSGCGKDSLLRAWFLLLCTKNLPTAIQFAILDGKGDWLTPVLAPLAHMFIAPVGGYGVAGDDAIKTAIEVIDHEAQRRQKIITAAGVRTREQYIAKTGNTMPIIVVVATDVMTSVAGEVENLLERLVSKARSLGIRVLVSMQTPTGKSTKWRMNLSTVIAGSLQAGSQDEPALGMAVKEMTYRPSQLPSPQTRPGVFVVRRGGSLVLVQAPFLDEARFDSLCEQLPTKPKTYVSPSATPDDLLSSLLHASPTPKIVPSTTPDADRLLRGFTQGGTEELVPPLQTNENSPFLGGTQEPVPTGTNDTNAVPTGTVTNEDIVIWELVRRGLSGNKIFELLGGRRADILEKVRQAKESIDKNNT